MRRSRCVIAAAMAIVVASATLVGMTDSAEAAGKGKVRIRFVNTPAAATTETDMTLGFARSVKHGIKAQQCKLDNGRWKDCFKRFAIADLADGQHTAQVRLVMKDGRKASDTRTWMVDTVAPSAPQVVGGGALWSNVASRSITHGESTDPTPSSGVKYERRISEDGGATWKPITGGDDIVVTREGDTRVEYRALDIAGNASEWVAASVRLDRTAPGLPTTSGGSALWRLLATVEVVNEKDADDPLSGVTPDGYELQTLLPGSDAWSAARTDVDGGLIVSAEGVTKVRFRAIDLAGNVGEWTAPEVVSLDHTAPSAPTLSGGSGGIWGNEDVQVLHNDDATDALSSVDPHGYEYQTSSDWGSTWADVPSDAAGMLTVSREGITYVRARATDMAGNHSQWAGLPSALIDRTAPAVPTVSAEGDWTNAPSVDVVATGSELNTGVPASGFAGYRIVTSTDGAPGVTIADGDGTFAFGDEGVTEVVAATCDKAGNCSDYSPVTEDAKVKIDRTAPAVPAVTGTTDWTNAASVDAGAASTDTLGAATGSGVDHYLVKTSTDGGTTYGEPAQSDSTLPVTGEGVNDVVAAACDLAGNCSDYSAIDPAAQVRIDRTAPAVPTVTGPTGWTNLPSATANAATTGDTLGAAESSGVDHYLVKSSADGGVSFGMPTETTSGTESVTSEGVTDVVAAACDTAGNCSGYSPVAPSAKVKIDRTAPVVPTVTGTTGWSNLSGFNATAVSADTLGAAVSSGLDRYLVKTSTDGGATYGPPANAIGGSHPVTAEGVTDVIAAACDQAGNCSDYSATDPSSKVRLDRTAPAVPTVTGTTGWSNLASMAATASSSDTLGAAASSGVDHYVVKTSIDGGASYSEETQTGSAIPVTAEGINDVVAEACDAAGNCSEWSPLSAAAKVRIDRTPPPAPTVTGGDAEVCSTSDVVFTVSGYTDALSGVADFHVRSDGVYEGWQGLTNRFTATWATFKPATGTVLRHIQVAVKDKAGNISAYSDFNAPGGIQCFSN